jgi:DNA-binding beta-propeller fold protein YncE
MRLSLMLGCAAATAGAAACPLAFVTTAGGGAGDDGLRVVDISRMALVATIGGIGDEPSRMVANANATRLWVSSYLPSSVGVERRGMIYAIDTATRRVVGSVAVGNRQNRAIALSPDASRVYTFRQEGSVPNATIALAVLDAQTLAPLADAPLPVTECLQFLADIKVHPDGRIFVSGCSDTIRAFDPGTLQASPVAPHPVSGGRMLGFSPNGAELYLPVGSATGSGIGTAIVAIDIATGASNPVSWAGGGAGFPTGSQPIRMLSVQRTGDAPGDPTVYFSYFSASGNSPVAHARASDLSPPVGPPLRQLLGRTNVGPASVVGASVDGGIGLGVRLGGARQLSFASSDPAVVIVGNGAVLALPGASALSDIVVDDGLYCDGYE